MSDDVHGGVEALTLTDDQVRFLRTFGAVRRSSESLLQVTRRVDRSLEFGSFDPDREAYIGECLAGTLDSVR